MDVNLPDGTTVRNVPDGTSRADLVQKLRANGRDVPAEWLAAPKAPTQSAPAPPADNGILAAAKDSVGNVYNLARGAVMGPLSDVAGLGAIPLHAAGAISTPPIDVKRNVQDAGAYTPTTQFGKATAAYNPLALLGKGIEKVAGAAERGVGGKDPGPLRAAAGYAARGAVEQAPMLAGAASEGAIGAAARGTKNLARDTMQSALKPPLAAQRTGKAATAIDTLLDEGANVSRGGIEKLSARIDDLNGRIAQVIANSPAVIDKYAVANRLSETMKKFRAQVNPNGDLAAIQKSFVDFLQHPSLGGPLKRDIPVQAAQTMKQGTYRALGDKAYGELKGAETEAQKALARGLKDEIAKAVPAVRQLNADESKLLTALPLVERRVLMSANKNPLGLGAFALFRPKEFMAWMADRSEVFKSLVARMMNSGSKALADAAPIGPPLAIVQQGQIAPPPQ